MSGVTSYRVTGDWRHVVVDGMVDPDDLPDEVLPTGHVVFTPVAPSVAVAGAPAVAYTLDVTTALIAAGELRDLQGRTGVMLAGEIGGTPVRWKAVTHLFHQGEQVPYPDLTFELTGDARLTGLIQNSEPGQPPIVIDPRIEGMVEQAQQTLDEMQALLPDLEQSATDADQRATDAEQAASAAAGSAASALEYRNTAQEASEAADDSAGLAADHRAAALGHREAARLHEEAARGYSRSAETHADDSAGSAGEASGHADTAGNRAASAGQSAQDAQAALDQVIAALADAEAYQDVLTAIGGLPVEWQADIQAAVEGILGGADPAFDTLIELQEALGSDPNFAATVADELGKRVKVDDPRLTDARTPTSHRHTTGEIDGLDDALELKSDVGHTHSWGQVTGKPGAYPSTVAQVVGLQDALDAKAATSHTHTPAEVGLGNVDNTSDANKPVSTATQAALDEKEPAAWTGTRAQFDALASRDPDRTYYVIG